MTAWSIITPPSEYSVESYFEMARKQIFVLDAFELNYAGVNPSMIRDPKNQDHIIMVLNVSFKNVDYCKWP